jgi:hypothetical protein
MGKVSLLLGSHYDFSFTKQMSIINLTIGLLALPLTILIILSSIPLLRKNSYTNIRLLLVVVGMDLVTCLTFIVGSILTLVDEDFFLTYDIACKIDYFFYDGSILSSTWLLAIVGLERFFNICMQKKFSLKLWYSMVGVLLLFFTGTGVYGLITNSIQPVPMNTYCFVAPSHNEGNKILLVLSIFNWISLITVIVSYTSISLYTYKVNRSTLSHVNQSLKSALKQKYQKTFVKVIALLIFFIITNGYETYLELREFITKSDRSPYEDIVATSIQNLNPLINSILLIAINDSLLKELCKLLGIKFEDSNDLMV